MKAIRIFYKDDKILWTCGLEGTGDFPYSIEETLKEYPDGTKVILLTDNIEAFLASDTNTIKNDSLIIGTPRPVVEPIPPRDVFKELDGLKAEVEALSAKS